jgi:AhpD family alkylhydroperoxidase
MDTFQIPKYKHVSTLNQYYFSFFHQHLGGVPNLYAMLAHSENALDTYWRLHNHKQSLTIPEKEIIGLIVSSINESGYCLETHIMIAKLNGFTDDMISEIRSGSAHFDSQYHALAQLIYSIVTTRGNPDERLFELFFEAGYTTESLVDAFIAIGDTVIANLLTCSMRVPSDSSSDKPD